MPAIRENVVMNVKKILEQHFNEMKRKSRRKKMAISMILAADEYGGIGYNNDLPWPRIDLDMRWFMDHTKR